MDKPEEDSKNVSALFSIKKKTGNPIKKLKLSTDKEEQVEIIRKPNVSSATTSITSETSKLDFATSIPVPVKSTDSAATAINEYDTEIDRDHLTRRRETLERSRELAVKGELDTKYRGLKGYQQFLMQGDTAKANAGSDKNKIAGPVRAAGNLRVTCRFDYKPDLCKDYNETGFCGFGDSCIFLHDRTEHKSSYQLEKEWEAEQKRKQLEIENSDSLISASKAAGSKPTTCPVCRGEFVNPVKSKCNHYFCEKCVFKEIKCPVCKSNLMGSFKPASKELKQ